VSVQAGHLDIRKVDLPGRTIPLTDPVRVLPGKPWTAA